MYFISARLLRLHKTLFYSTTSSRWKQDAKLPKNTASRLQTSRRHDTIEKRKGEGAAMNYAAIKNCDIANGPGVRVSLFVSGCRHHCKDCFNPETWDFACGELFDEAVMDKLLALLAPGYIRGITYLGGEPFEPENQPGLLELSRRIKAAYPEKSIWSFTGYLFDRDILAKKLGPWEVTQELLSYLDVLVDGPFVASLKNLNLRFRGSSNQRLIDVPASLKTGAVVLWDERQ
jgi:anaerobic ribonucleoside-triphosphate reductase activating protein